MDALLRKRLLRAGTILLLGWLVLEVALIRLVADRFGWGLALLAMTLKGGLGLALLFALALRGLSRLRDYIAGRTTLEATLGSAFGVAAAMLIALPGFLPALAGLALLLPAMRAWCIRFYAAGSRRVDPDVVDLQAGDWAEARAPGAASPIKEEAAGDAPRGEGAASLERKPPSV